jgi:phytoene dehydrogenase-like protein
MMSWSCVPYQLPAHGGPEKWDEIREDYGDKVDRLLAEYNPGMMDSVVARYCNSPLDYYRKNPSQVMGASRSGVAGGRWYGTARPFPGCGAPRTPFANLYLSNSIWPFGTTTLGAGYVAATAVAEDLGVREAQDWWKYRPLEAGLEVLKRRGIEIEFTLA